MKPTTTIYLSAIFLCFGCTDEMTGVAEVTNEPQPQLVVSSGVQELDHQIDKEFDSQLRTSFRSGQLTFQEGHVVANGDSPELAISARRADEIIRANGYSPRPGAKVLFSEEPEFNRVIWQQLLESGRAVGEYTILTDKVTNKEILGVNGFYAGPLP